MKELYRRGGIVLGISNDEMNFQIREEKIIKEGKKKGQLFITNRKYFSQIDACLKKYCDIVGRREAKDLRGYIETVQNVWDEIRVFCDSLTGS